MLSGFYSRDKKEISPTVFVILFKKYVYKKNADMKKNEEVKKVIFEELKQRKKMLFVVSLIHMSAMVLSVLIPLLNGKFLDLLISQTSLTELINYALLIVSIGLTGALLTYIYSILSTKIKNRFAFEINIRVINHLHGIELRRFEEYNAAYLNQRINADSTTISSFIFDNFMVVVMNAIQFTILAFILIWIKMDFFVVILSFIPVYILIYMILKKPLYVKGIRYKEEQNIFFDRMNEQLVMNKEIKIHSDAEKNEEIVRKQYGIFLSALIRLTKVSGLFNSLDSIVCLVFQAISLILGGSMVIEKKITLGEYSILSLYFANILGIIKYFFNFGKGFQDYKTSSDRMNDLLEIPAEEDGEEEPEDIKNLTVSINNYKYRFERGRLNVIFGKNGVGKTTLLFTLVGVFRNQCSEVYIGDSIIGDVNMYNIRKNAVSFMLQNEKTGDISVKKYLQQNLGIESKDDLACIMEKYNLMDLFCNERIRIFDLFEKSLLGISDGERQMVVLLKTLARESQLIILDEPSSNLNLSVTKKLISYLQSIKNKKLVIVVSHESEFVKQADNAVEVIGNQLLR